MRYIVLALLLLTANRFLPEVTLAEEAAPLPATTAGTPDVLGAIDAPDAVLPEALTLKIAAFQAPPRLASFARPALEVPDALPAVLAESSALPPAAVVPEAATVQDPVPAALETAGMPAGAEHTEIPVANTVAAGAVAPEDGGADVIDATAAEFVETDIVDAAAAGFASTDSASPDAAAAMVAEVADPGPVVADTSDLRAVTASTLNVRQGPSSSTPVVATLKGGDLLTVTGERKGGWVKVATGDRQQLGWVYSLYLETLGDA